jgi:predicted DNA binding CopG/RHH family protein
MSAKLKQIPAFASDDEAELFVEHADLAQYDLSGFRPVRFEIEKKTKQVNVRMPESLINALKARAKERNVPYQRLIREAIELALQRP